jgi:hypothetical protein
LLGERIIISPGSNQNAYRGLQKAKFFWVVFGGDITADREFRKAEKKRFKTELKNAKNERAVKAKEHDRENSPGQNGEDF